MQQKMMLNCGMWIVWIEKMVLATKVILFSSFPIFGSVNEC